MAYGRSNFAREEGLTDTVLQNFDAWHRLLTQWNAKINLVSKSAAEHFWFRHALDSWQVSRHIPAGAQAILDLGSGSGFPGLALAIAAKDQQPTSQITLVESAGKKASFLRTVIRELNLPATVKSERAETMPPLPYNVISARAFAPLPRLLTYAQPFWGEHTKAVLLKGQALPEELTEAQKYWSFQSDISQSRSDPQGEIVVITDLKKRE